MEGIQLAIWKNQQGYSILLTLGIIIIFAILGTALITLTTNGAAKNEVRQDITRSSDLTQKGIDLVTTQVNTELTAFLGVNGRPKTEFASQLETILNKYLCTNVKIPVVGETGTHLACIVSYTDTLTSDNIANPLRKLVTFRSIGTSGDANRELINKIEIGAATVPEALKYAIGTNIDSTDGMSPGEGNLIMHGGSEITGDLKVDGDIVTSTNGYAYLGGDQWIPSLAPSAKPIAGAETSRLFLGKKAYTFNTASSYANHIVKSSFSSSPYTMKTKISDLFRPGAAPVLVSREPVQSPIAISQQKQNFEFSKTSSGVSLLNAGSSFTIYNQNLQTTKTFLHHNYTSGKTNYSGDSGTYTFKGTNTFKQVATNGNVILMDTDTTFQNGLYVKGDMQIGNNSTSYNTNYYSEITLDGPMYINGDLTIKGADLKSNALIYVNGEVTIQHSRINGKTLKSGKKGSLIVMAKGNIKISNNSVNYDDPSYIKGFFYSEKDFEMYGVGSNIKIDGGISARKIVLNAIRGRAKDDPFAQAHKIPYRNDYFEGVAEQAKRDSRLQVSYDAEIIQTYSDLKQQEPVIYAIEPPIEQERSVTTETDTNNVPTP